MKKEKFYLSVSKTLLLFVAILFSFSQPSFAQKDATATKTADSAATASSDATAKTADKSESLGDPKKGKELFNTNCAACHKRYERSTGPALHGVTKIKDLDWIYKWVHNSTAVLNSGDQYAQQLFQEYNQTPMTHFPQLSKEDINNILAYVEQPKPTPKKPTATAATTATASSGGGASTNVILGILAFILIILVVILILVNKTLRRFAKERGITVHDNEGKPKGKPLWKSISENQFLMVAFSIILTLAASYWFYWWTMQIGVDQGYQPVQPIHFSHRIHAGENKIECKYCHYSARVSKVSGIPSLNVCMNCHMAISEVAPETATKKYSKEYYDKQIAKLYDAVGWDPEKHQYTGKTHPVKWVRIHNLPDFAYYNHSQHVMVAKVQCQKCHGPVQEMEVVKQYAKLTMGWCINCHRTTDVKMKGNKYYEKIHKQLEKKYGLTKLTEAQMGGVECGRCHY